MLFGVNTTKLLRYLAPLESDDFVEYGYNADALNELLMEKAEIVFSYLPQRYRILFKERVYRLILLDYAYSGQTEIRSPFPSMDNIVGYLNPEGKLSELKDCEKISLVVDDGLRTISFSSLDLGDQIVADFDLNIEDMEIRSLVWATNVLAGADLMSIISSETKTANILPRVRMDAERVFPWLQGLNSPSIDDRIIIKDLEHSFWEGEKTFSDRIDLAQRKLIDGVSV